MATNTTNYQLVKPALTDSPPDITAMNPNWDTIDAELKKNADSAKVAQTYETAGGTGTAITIASLEFVNGVSRTFIASANNGGAATTLNGKPIYKPNTTTAPNIVAGKAYTVWYNVASGCFFLKASAEGNAVAANVLAGTTFSNDDDTGILGEMTDNGPAAANTVNLTSHNQEYTIAKGYHSGLRKIKAVITNLAAGVIKAGTTVGGVLGTFTSDATAVAGNILSGATAYVNGNKVTGTMANIGKVTPSLGINGNYTIPEGYHDGTGTVSQNVATKGAATITPGTSSQVISAGQYLTGDQIIAGDPDLVTGNIKSGVNLFGVAGKASVVETSDANAVAGNILSGKTAYKNGAKLTGTMTNRGAITKSLTTQGASYTVPVGYHSGSGKVTASFSNLSAGNVRKGVNIGGVVGTVAEADLSEATSKIDSSSYYKIETDTFTYLSASKVTNATVFIMTIRKNHTVTLTSTTPFFSTRDNSFTTSKSISAGSVERRSVIVNPYKSDITISSTVYGTSGTSTMDVFGTLIL